MEDLKKAIDEDVANCYLRAHNYYDGIGCLDIMHYRSLEAVQYYYESLSKLVKQIFKDVDLSVFNAFVNEEEYQRRILEIEKIKKNYIDLNIKYFGTVSMFDNFRIVVKNARINLEVIYNSMSPSPRMVILHNLRISEKGKIYVKYNFMRCINFISHDIHEYYLEYEDGKLYFAKAVNNCFGLRKHETIALEPPVKRRRVRIVD